MAAWARDIDVDIDGDKPGQLALDAAVFDPDGHAHVAATLTGPREDPRELGSAWPGPSAPGVPSHCSSGPGSGPLDGSMGRNQGLFSRRWP